ncbi:MAG: hypothetical protein KatS3mg103_1104 [Phycisphaerales bacterium]|nr:MAG: hypothetical protein KatS3mg103_1104 [Phycisphaerales bacterium]
MKDQRATMRPSVALRAAASRQATGLCQTCRGARWASPSWSVLPPCPNARRVHDAAGRAPWPANPPRRTVSVLTSTSNRLAEVDSTTQARTGVSRKKAASPESVPASARG